MTSLPSPAVAADPLERLSRLEDPVTLNTVCRAVGFAPLHEAVRAGSPGLVQLLLERKADPNLRTTALGGVTALHLAARRDADQIAEVLIAHGASVDALSLEGKATPLHEACRAGAETTAVRLLLAGANARLLDGDGFPACQLAKASGYLSLASRLPQVPYDHRAHLLGKVDIAAFRASLKVPKKKKAKKKEKAEAKRW